MAQINQQIDFLISDTARYFEAVELKYLEIKLNQMQREMWAWFYKQGLHHSNYQPRVPAGNPDGGQWTDEPVTIPDKSDELFYVKTIKTPNGKRLNRANIFIGGFNDRDDHKNVLSSSSLQKYTYGDNYYSTHDSRNSIIKLINKMPKGRRVNLIGHSLGGDTAADIVEIKPNRIHTSITINPVSRRHVPDFNKVKKHSKVWINVNAVGEGISIGDISATFGGAWNDSPKNYANRHIPMPFNHEYFNDMMMHLFDGQTNIQTILK